MNTKALQSGFLERELKFKQQQQAVSATPVAASSNSTPSATKPARQKKDKKHALRVNTNI